MEDLGEKEAVLAAQHDAFFTIPQPLLRVCREFARLVIAILRSCDTPARLAAVFRTPTTDVLRLWSRLQAGDADAGGGDGAGELGDVVRVAGDDEPAAGGDADGDHVGVDHSVRAAAGGGEDGPDAPGEIEVGVDQPEDRPFTLHGVVPGHGGFDLLDTTEHGWDGSDLRSGGRR